jgi:hypothetical protein
MSAPQLEFTVKLKKMDETATKNTWKNIPMDQPKRIEITLRFTEQQFSGLIKGHIPEAMEDKWFIYFENDWLYFHRSWTGFGIYKAKLNKENEGYSINEFWAERNQEKYTNESDKQDMNNIASLIAGRLLGIITDQIYSDKNQS